MVRDSLQEQGPGFTSPANQWHCVQISKSLKFQLEEFIQRLFMTRYCVVFKADQAESQLRSLNILDKQPNDSKFVSN